MIGMCQNCGLNNIQSKSGYVQSNYFNMMNACFASFNTKGFSSSLSNPNSTALPAESHITYDGCFNELKYSIGPRAQKRMELHLGYARAQNADSAFNAGINNFLTVFTKGSRDGQDRDETILNAVIVLDISGSMNGSLNAKKQGIRLQLAKQAIKMFLSKLRPNDAFGLVLFDNNAQELIPLTRADKLDIQQVHKQLLGVRAGGGTTLNAGLQGGLNLIKQYLETAEYTKEHKVENRMVILTDVADNSVSHSKQFVSNIEKSNIHTTIIGISDSFKSQVCEQLAQVKGFNYFCATEIDDLQKYLFNNFSFSFFPDVFDIEISVTNTNTRSIQVYGTVDSAKVHNYNVESVDNFIITKSKTSFPSELQLELNGDVKTYGGLILVNLNLKDKESQVFEGVVHLKYRTSEGQFFQDEYPFKYESPKNQQFYSDECLYEALSGYFYVFEVKNILKAINEEGNKPEVRQRYLEPLKKLRNLAPASKKDQLDKLILKFEPKKVEQEVQ